VVLLRLRQTDNPETMAGGARPTLKKQLVFILKISLKPLDQQFLLFQSRLRFRRTPLNGGKNKQDPREGSIQSP
jgi:hypothetical protein